ncbi:hypothetical protein CEP51_004763 [Fusarium floridanum]|uniref:DUF3669 domain-containing protein n=1 Tax=Fusarium floridanum TaxID=1325733 RepID=A0A428RZM4_9HYPO|nr:hypothetical protein CEP51_004763 [Fusarium floridanum]
MDISRNKSADELPTRQPDIDALATEELSKSLDRQRNTHLEENFRQEKGLSRIELASRLLSLDATTSNRSFSIPKEIPGKNIGFRKIGFGQCGLVFEWPGREMVVKVARPGFQDALWVDHEAHKAVYSAFLEQDNAPRCRVPRLYSHISKDDQWWQENKRLFMDQHDDFPFPSSALTSEHILPLAGVVREILIEKYCPQSMQQAALENPLNRDCLARVYLGRRRSPQQPRQVNFSLRNFNLCLDQIVDLGLPASSYASAIGEALAVIHWVANVDGYDVEFVLGSEASVGSQQQKAPSLQPTQESPWVADEGRRKTARIWVLDFNLCTKWEEEIGWEQPEALVEQLVMAFFENDPYYPLPLMDDDLGKQLWSVFRDSYTTKAEEILREKDERLRALPNRFINACIEREQQNIDNGLGHGHRQHKG